MATIVTTNGPDFEEAKRVGHTEMYVEANVPLMDVPEWESHFEDRIRMVLENHLAQHFEGEYQTLEDFQAVAERVGYTKHARIKDYCLDAFGDERGQDVFDQYETGVRSELQEVRVPVEIPWSNIDYIVPDN